MAILLSEAANCENHAEGYEGAAHQMGNQTGTELRTVPYYNRPFTKVYRFKDSSMAQRLAVRMLVSVANSKIGYGQPTRLTYWAELQKHNYDPAKIDTPCDCDCSSLENACAECCFMEKGIASPISHTLVTSQMPSAYSSASAYFDDVTAQIDLATGKGLQVGDVLVNPGVHTAVCTSADSVLSSTPKWVGEVTGASIVPVYSDVNENGRCQYPNLGLGNLVDVCDEKGAYYYIRIAAKYYGFIEKAYLKNHTQSQVRQGTVTTALNMRTSAPNGSVIRVLPQGAVVTINGEERVNGRVWYNCTYAGSTGWCSSLYIK